LIKFVKSKREQYQVITRGSHLMSRANGKFYISIIANVLKREKEKFPFLKKEKISRLNVIYGFSYSYDNKNIFSIAEHRYIFDNARSDSLI